MRFNLKLTFTSLIMAFCGHALLHAQPSFQSGDFDLLTELDGLSYPTVYCFHQDTRGYMWIGTFRGLNCYDGYRMKSYKHDPNVGASISNNDIKCFFESSDGTLYVGTDKGLNILDTGADTFELIPFTADYSVRCVAQDAKGDLWAGTTKGLLHYQSESNRWRLLSKVNDLTPLSYDYVLYVTVDSRNNLIIGTYGYLCVKRDGADTFECFSLPLDASNQNKMISWLVEDERASGNIFVGTEQGLFRTNVETGRSEPLLPGQVITSLCYDMQKNLWIATRKGIFVREAKNDRILPLRSSDALSQPVSPIWVLYNDRDANMWVGSDNGAAMTKTDDRFRFMSTRDLIGRDNQIRVTSILDDRFGNIWITTTDGLIKYRPDDQSEYFTVDSGPSKSLSHSKVGFMLEDGTDLWLATDNGLNRYCSRTGRIYKYTISDASGQYHANWVYSLGVDKLGNLWLGTYENGLFVVDKKRLAHADGKVLLADTHFHTSKPGRSISSNIVNSIVCDRKGYIWIGTDHTGIDRIDPETFGTVTFNAGNSGLSSNNILQLAASESEIFIASGSGLNIVGSDGMSILKIAEESIREPVIFIVPQKEYLWLKTGSGIGRLERKSGNLQYFSIDGRSYTTGYYSRMRNMMFLGTFNGVTFFNPDSMTSESEKDGLRITNVMLANEPVEIGRRYGGNVILHDDPQIQKSVKLNYKQNTFSIEFSSFQFRRRKDNVYYYRLYGFDNQWQKTEGRNNKASFINIPPGKYQFQVKNDFGGNAPVSTLDISIASPWYGSVYAMLFYFMVFVLIVWQIWRIVRYRQMLVYERLEQKKITELAEMKTEFFSNVSHDFKTPLSIILERVRNMLAEKPDDRQKTGLVSIEKNARKINKLISQLIDISSNDSDMGAVLSKASIVELARGVVAQYEEQMAAKQINFLFESDAIDYAFLVDRAAMESVVDNLMSNAVKFTSEGGSVRVSVRVSQDSPEDMTVEISVSDTGCGIPPEDIDKVFNRFYQSDFSREYNRSGSGIGLSIVRKTVEAHNGKIAIESEPGRGTTISIYLTTSKLHMLTPGDVTGEAGRIAKVNTAARLGYKPVILIVEDDAEITELLCSALGRNFEILTAADGEQGLVMCIEHIPQLVLTDLMMPRMNGLEMSRQLKENINTSLIPIIMLTAKSDLGTEITARYKSIDAFIPKPFNMPYLEHRIVQLIAQQAKIAEKIREREMVQPKKEVVVSADEKIFGQIVETIEENLTNPDLNVSMLCREIGMSEKYIYRKVKSLTGQTIVEFIRNIRLKKAAIYLRQDKLSVSEVMHLVGFSNHSYFTKCFKEQYGVLPREYASGD